jgi:hypothetical protein
VLSLFAAAVQLNDPDPVAWFLIYAAAAVVAAATIRFVVPVVVPLALAAISFAWSTTLVGTVWRSGPPLNEVLAVSAMTTRGVEEAREAIGLWLVTIAMCLAARRAARRYPLGRK